MPKARASSLKQGPGGRLGSARSKTGDPQCSRAMSLWVRARHSGGAVAAEVFKVLGRCRAKARALRMSRDHALAGNEAKSQVYAARAERGLSGAARDRLAAQKREELVERRLKRAGGGAKPGALGPRAGGALVAESSAESGPRAGLSRHIADRAAAIEARNRAARSSFPASRIRPGSERVKAAEVVARARAARAPKPAPKPEPGFSLRQESATGKAGFKVQDLGRGRTGTLFDMKKGDLPGQTSLLDRVGSTESNPRAKRLRRLGIHSEYDRAMESQRRSHKARELVAQRAAKRAAAAVKPAAKGGVKVAKLSGAPGKVSAEFELGKAREKLAHRTRTAARLREARSMKNEHTHPELYGKPDTPYHMDVKHIHFDPERFQYKLGAQGSHGTTESLKDVTEWNPKLAGIVSVWRDPADGRTYVVNGHHRIDLAKRLGAGKVKVQYLDSPDAKHARAEGALMNIAEGRGTALDAAKFFRDRGMTPDQARAHGVSLKEHTAKQGLAMANLDEGIFRRVVRGEMTPERASIIGAAGLSHDEQRGLMKILDKPKNRNLTNGTVKNLADMAKQAGTVKQKTRDLFGESEEEQSLAVHRANLEDKIKRQLAGDTKLFGLVSKSKAAQALADRADSNIDVEKSGAVADEARALLHYFDHLKKIAGPLSDSLNEGALKLHKSGGGDKVYEEHYKLARKSLHLHLSGDAFARDLEAARAGR